MILILGFVQAQMEQFLPEQTIATFYFCGVKNWQQSQDPAWNHPELQDCLNMFEEIIQSISKRLPISETQREEIKEIFPIFDSEFCIAAFFTESKELVPVLLINPGKLAAEKIPVYLNKYLRAKSKKIKIKNIEIEQFQVGPNSIFTAIEQDRYVIALTQAGLEKYLSRDPKKSLANSTHFQTIRNMLGETKGTTALLGYVNTEMVFSFLQDLGKKIDDPKMQFGLSKLDVLGLKTWKGLIFNQTRGKTSCNNLIVWNDGTPTGLFELFNFSGGNPKPLMQHIPCQVSQMVYINLDMLKFWKQILEIAKNIEPKIYEELMGQLLKMEKEIGWKLEQQILKPLSGEILSVTFDKELSGITLHLLKLRDTKQFSGTLTRLQELAKLERKEIEYRGEKIYYIVIPQGDIQNLIGGEYKPGIPGLIQYQLNTYLQFNPCFIVKDDVLIVSNLVQNLKDYLDYKANHKSTELPFALNTETPFVLWDNSSVGTLYWYNTLLPILSWLESPMREVGIPWDNSRLPSAEAIKALTGSSQTVWEHFDKGIRITSESRLQFVSPIAIVGTTGVLAALTLPALAAVQEKAKISSSQARLTQIGQALLMYKMDHGKYPPYKNPDFFVELYKKKVLEKNSLVLFREPASDADFAANKPTVTDYEVRTKPPKSMTQNTSVTILAWTKKGIHAEGRVVLFLDGHVEFVKEEDFLKFKE